MDERNIYCELNYLEEEGMVCLPENDSLFDDEGSHSERWGKIIISSAAMPEKYHFTIYPNSTGKERKIRFGFNCFRYDYRIVNISQPADTARHNVECPQGDTP